MTLALLVLAAATPDLAFDAYGKCAQGAAAAYKGPADTLEAVAGRVEESCASDRAALIAAAPDKKQAAEWVRMTTTLAVTEHVPGLASGGPVAKVVATTPAASRYPKLDAYRACGEENAAKIAGEIPYATVAAIAGEAVAACEKLLKPAAEEAVTEMRQPSLRQQVTADFRRRATSELTQKINADRIGKAAP